MSYLLPTLDIILSKIQGCDIFLVMNLNQVYLQLQLDEEAKTLLVVNALCGLYENLRLPFGLSSSFSFLK